MTYWVLFKNHLLKQYFLTFLNFFSVDYMLQKVENTQSCLFHVTYHLLKVLDIAIIETASFYQCKRKYKKTWMCLVISGDFLNKSMQRWEK